MRSSALSNHVCATCRSPKLRIEGPDETDAVVVDGSIICSDCAAMFPIRDGIPRFVPASNYANSFGFQWNKYAKAQLDSHTGIPISTDRLRAALGTLDLKGERILEAGSGAGRFTEVLAKSGAEVVSFDFSSAVDANAANLGADRTVHLFQGDIFNIPLRPRSFDRVVCLGVVQHTPDPRSAFLSLSEYVKPGGQVVIDVYTRSATALMSWKYLLRPITKRMSQERLYNIIAWGTPRLVPVARFLRRVAGRAGSRIVPIVEYSYLGLPNRLNVDWAVLDTFDMYSPQHDHPQSMATVKAWFEQVGFEKVSVRPGPNGVVASGHRPM